MTRRIVLGARNNGDVGLFVSPAGVDAFTAADSALRLSVTSKISALIMAGLINGSGTISMGLSRSPYVMLTSHYNMGAISGHVGGPGPMRPGPVPLAGYSGCYGVINSNGASLSITVGSDPIVYYQVYSAAFT